MTPGSLKVTAINQADALLKACMINPSWLNEKVLIHLAVEEILPKPVIESLKAEQKRQKRDWGKQIKVPRLLTQKKDDCVITLKCGTQFLQPGYRLGQRFSCCNYQGGWQLSLTERGTYICKVDSLKEGVLLANWLENYLNECEYPSSPIGYAQMLEIYRLKLMFTWMSEFLILEPKTRT